MFISAEIYIYIEGCLSLKQHKKIQNFHVVATGCEH